MDRGGDRQGSPPSGWERALLTTATLPTPPGGRCRANAGSGCEGVLGGELIAGAALREHYGFARSAELGGELALRFVVYLYLKPRVI